jgi:zinc transport system permease protein
MITITTMTMVQRMITTTTIIKRIMIMDDFLLRAALAGIGLALAAGPLGTFVVWRRMAYFGDATSHAAILGVALALAFDLPIGFGTLFIGLLMAVTVSTLAARGWAMDTTLGVVAHSALAFGLVAVSFLQGVRVDLSAYLFGDILAVSSYDLGMIWLGSLAVVLLLIWRWSGLLMSTVSEDLAYASGYKPDFERLILTLALALTVALALKIVGALLIGAMLIIPAAAARNLSRTPEGMAIGAAILGGLSALCGLMGSFSFDTPAGPSIVATAAVMFVLCTLVGKTALGRV